MLAVVVQILCQASAEEKKQPKALSLLSLEIHMYSDKVSNSSHHRMLPVIILHFYQGFSATIDTSHNGIQFVVNIMKMNETFCIDNGALIKQGCYLRKCCQIYNLVKMSSLATLYFCAFFYYVNIQHCNVWGLMKRKYALQFENIARCYIYLFIRTVVCC